MTNDKSPIIKQPGNRCMSLCIDDVGKFNFSFENELTYIWCV